MDMQMQFRRGVIAVVIWAVLGGIVLSRAGTPADSGRLRTHLMLPVALAQSVPDGGAASGERDCLKHLRIELTPAMRLTIPCEHSCGPIRNVARALGMPVAMIGGNCEAWRTA